MLLHALSSNLGGHLSRPQELAPGEWRGAKPGLRISHRLAKQEVIVQAWLEGSLNLRIVRLTVEEDVLQCDGQGRLLWEDPIGRCQPEPLNKA